MSLSLDKRLNMAASLVREHRFTVDVGTDHAYLPAFLVLSGKTEQACACDIAEGPLKNAAKTVEKYCLQNNITLILSDGLKSVEPFKSGDIVICGMGGNLISDILEAADWVCAEDIHLVLQPMSHSEDVRCWLVNHGFRIEKEEAQTDGRHIYICISAYYTGDITVCNPGYYYFGELGKSSSPCAGKYIEAIKERLRKRLSVLEGSAQFNDEVLYLRTILDYGEKL